MRTLTALLLMLVAVGTVYAEPVENPSYAFWAAFVPDTVASYDMRTTMMGMEGQADVVVTLVEVTDEKAVINTDITMTMMGQQQQMPPESEDVPAQIEPEDMDPMSRALFENKDNGEEEMLEVDGQELICTRYTFEDVDGLSGQVWLCDQVPSGLVKMQGTSNDPQIVGDLSIELRSFTVAE